MSRIRNTWIHDSEGNKILVDDDGRIEVSVGDETGAEWLLNNGGMPINLHDGDGLPWVQDANGGMPVNSIITDATGNELTLEPDGSLPVTLQDQTTPTVIVPLNNVSNTTTVLTLGVRDTSTIDVTVTTGFVDGVFIVIADLVNNRYYTGTQIGAIAGNTVTLDTPLDFAYAVDSIITNGTTNMNVDGSVTPQVFGLRVSDPGLPLTVDVTRLMFICTTGDPVDLSKFGDIVGGLTNGIVIRKRDGTFNNIFNAKTNAALAGIMFDFVVQAKTNPAQGQDGFIGRLTFAGQNKMGVTVRVGPDEDLECIIQDDLTTLETFTIIAEGSVVSE